MENNAVSIEVSPGELLDKISILEIKQDRMSDPVKLENVRLELSLLSQARDHAIEMGPNLTRLCGELRAVNEKLWEIEDDLRDCERRGEFGDVFVQLARAVYHTNDRRAELKREINLSLGSSIVEEKDYAPY